jgi:hypothetical protein
MKAELGNTPADKNYKPSGINKAEERALEAYPDGIRFPFTPLDLNAYRRASYIQGYEQAEKDMQFIPAEEAYNKGFNDGVKQRLTWEDVQLLHIITEKYMRELDNRIEVYPSSSQELFEEVLRRFNQKK